LVPDFRTTITYNDAARQQLTLFDAHPEQQEIDHELDATFDRLVKLAQLTTT
jgi:hypothetical protein